MKILHIEDVTFFGHKGQANKACQRAVSDQTFEAIITTAATSFSLNFPSARASAASVTYRPKFNPSSSFESASNCASLIPLNFFTNAEFFLILESSFTFGFYRAKNSPAMKNLK